MGGQKTPRPERRKAATLLARSWRTCRHVLMRPCYAGGVFARQGRKAPNFFREKPCGRARLAGRARPDILNQPKDTLEIVLLLQRCRFVTRSPPLHSQPVHSPRRPRPARRRRREQQRSRCCGWLSDAERSLGETVEHAVHAGTSIARLGGLESLSFPFSARSNQRQFL